MNQQVSPQPESADHSLESTSSMGLSAAAPVQQFRDNRPEAVQMRAMQSHANQSPRVHQLRAIQARVDGTRSAAPAEPFGVMQCRFQSAGVIQRILRIADGPIGTFDDIEVFVQDLDGLRGSVLQAVPDATAHELDNAVRSIDLRLDAGPDNMGPNQATLLEQLPQEIRANRDQANGTTTDLEGVGLPPAIAAEIAEKLGSKESQRMLGIVTDIWQQRFIGIDQMVALLQEPELVNDHFAQFRDFFASLSDHPLACKTLLRKPPRDVASIVKSEENQERFKDQVMGMQELAEASGVDPMHAIDMGQGARYDPMVQDVVGLERDFQVIAQNLDFNLKEDLAYIAQLETTFSQTGEGPDQAKLTAEIDRMKKIYTHKVNYLSIIRDHDDYFSQLAAELRAETQAIDSAADQDIAALQAEKKAVKDPTFRPQATPGYRMRKTRDAESQRSGFQRQMVTRETQRQSDTTQAKRTQSNKQEAFRRKAAEFLHINKKFVALLEQGVLMLPSDMRMAGIFPNSASVQLGAEDEAGHHGILAEHARELIAETGMYQGTMQGKEGILPGSRAGCVCIMYVKEGDFGDEGGATFRPILGASGVSPYDEPTSGASEEEVVNNSYTQMGVPTPDRDDLSHANAAGNLGQHVDDMQRLGIKPPSMQSQLYFLQTPEYQANKVTQGDQADVPEEVLEQARENTIGLLESWMPSNCAEPAIMTAIYQMYHAPKDIYLSVPFEGQLTADGQLLLKYTCTRCAVSEPAFVSPMLGGHEEITDMHTHGDQEDHPPQERLLRARLIHNATNTHHPYVDKAADIRATMARNAELGFSHIGALPLQEAVEQAEEAVHRVQGPDDRGGS